MLAVTAPLKRAGSLTHIELPGQVLCGSVWTPPPRDWYLEPGYVGRALRHLGIRHDPGESFECVLPGASSGAEALIHPEYLTYVRLGTRPTDRLSRDSWLHLAEVHASAVSGRVLLLRPDDRDAPPRAWVTLMRWSDSLASEIGLASGRTAMHRPSNLSEDELRLVERFGLLFASTRTITATSRSCSAVRSPLTGRGYRNAASSVHCATFANSTSSAASSVDA